LALKVPFHFSAERDEPAFDLDLILLRATLAFHSRILAALSALSSSAFFFSKE
jgi:hypothetical protein